MTAVARFDRFTKVFGDTVAVESLSYQVQPGRVVGLLGRNGAGKTTSLRGLLGLLRPTSGSATVFGVPYRELVDPARRVGVTMDGVGVNPSYTGRRHLEICARATGITRARVDEVLDLVEIGDAADRAVRHWSTGMRQRLSLATALLGDPELLVLDEPANGLDPDGVRWLRTLLRSFAAEGRTVLLSSHLLAEIEQTVDDVVVLQCTLRFAGSLSELTDGGKRRLEDCFFDLVGTAPRRDGVRPGDSLPAGSFPGGHNA